MSLEFFFLAVFIALGPARGQRGKEVEVLPRTLGCRGGSGGWVWVVVAGSVEIVVLLTGGTDGTEGRR